MTTSTAVIARAPNCPSSSFIDSATTGSAWTVCVTVTVGTGVGSLDGEGDISLDVGVGVADSLGVADGSEGNASGVEGEGDGVTNKGKPPPVGEPFKESHN
jgi:hypothetical protein